MSDERTVTIELSVNEVNAVLEALSNMPYRSVSALIPKIANSSNQQLSPKEEAEAE